MQRTKAAPVLSSSGRLRARVLFLVLASGGVAAAAAFGCSDDKPSYPPGAIPSIVAVKAAEALVLLDDAGVVVGGCCPFPINVSFALPEGEFIKEGYVQWATLESPVRFQYPAREADPDAGSGGGARTVTLDDVEVPQALVAKNVKLAFTVVLVSGRGERSAPAGGTLSINPSKD